VLAGAEQFHVVVHNRWQLSMVPDSKAGINCTYSRHALLGVRTLSNRFVSAVSPQWPSPCKFRQNYSSGMDETLLRELSKSRSSSRKELLFQHVITEDRDKSLLTAYKVKREIKGITPSSPSHVKIQSTDPLPVLPEGKYSHCRGARISPITLTRSQQNVSMEYRSSISLICSRS
jgi:hypothetical protein